MRRICWKLITAGVLISALSVLGDCADAVMEQPDFMPGGEAMVQPDFIPGCKEMVQPGFMSGSTSVVQPGFMISCAAAWLSNFIPGGTETVLAAEDPAVLWVVTEQTVSDGMNYQAQKAAESFEEAHEGITVRIDILPTDPQEREICLKQLRAQIMAGKGPDVYLLPTGTVLTTDSPTSSSQIRYLMETEIDPLFQDVTQAMYSGVFQDISSWYDGDADLNTGGLQTDVMNAGVLEGCRYVLPLRYTMPVLLTDLSTAADSGISQERIDSGIGELAKLALNSGDSMMAAGLQMPDDTSRLGQLFDYEKGEMLVTEQDIADYMRLYQAWYAMADAPAKQLITDCLEELRALLDEALHYSFDDVLAELNVTVSLDSFNDAMDYVSYGYHWSLDGFPLFSDSLVGVLYQSALGKVLEKDLAAQPLRGMDGSVTAEITYFGAVGSSCETPELAYAYLREFLTEAYQWDLVRPRASRTNIDYWNLPQELQTDGFVENSWPVRAKGAAPYLWDTFQYQLFYDNRGIGATTKRQRTLKAKSLTVTDEDLSILDVPIDFVGFPIVQPYEESLSWALAQLNGADGTPTDVDIDGLAGQVYRYLWWHLAEG